MLSGFVHRCIADGLILAASCCSALEQVRQVTGRPLGDVGSAIADHVADAVSPTS